MKIAIIGSKDFDSLEYHINDSLMYLGHKIFHVDIKDVMKIPYKYNYWASKLIPKYDALIFNKIAEQVIGFKPDLVIGTYRFINPLCVSLIKNALPYTKIIHINPDQLTTLEHQQIFASNYDAYFTKDKFILDFMKNKMNLNAFYLPEALNLRIHKSPNKNRLDLERELDIDVVAFGTMYPYRAKLISELIKKEIKMTLFGVPDKRFPREDITSAFTNEYITGARKADVLYGSKIVLNNFHYAEIYSANVKYFEIAGIGGFQICDYKNVLEEYSCIDVLKYTFKSVDEAAELIKYYLNRPIERHELATLQQQYFLKHHNYEVRMEEILKQTFK